MKKELIVRNVNHGTILQNAKTICVLEVKKVIISDKPKKPMEFQIFLSPFINLIFNIRI